MRESFLYLGCFGLLMCIFSFGLEGIKKTVSTTLSFLQNNTQTISYQNKLIKTMSSLGLSFQDIEKSKKKYIQGILGLFCICFVLFIITKQWLWVVIPFLYAAMVPFQLKRKLAYRNQQISRYFPYFLDLVTLCLESGMDPMRSMKEICKTKPTHPLCQEIHWALASTHLGQSLQSALLEVANRTQHEDLGFLATSLQQSAELGSSLVDILKMQSETLRDKIYKQAQIQAQKAPVKILFPLIFCIFPVIFILLFLPIGIELFSVF